MSEEKIIETGNVKISEEVIAVISGVAANEVKGVAAMSSSFAGGIAEFLGKKSYAKGVKVELTETTVGITLSYIAEYGHKIPDVAWEIQEKVKKAVESMTGLEVLKVDVIVAGVALPKEETTAPEKKEETEE